MDSNTEIHAYSAFIEQLNNHLKGFSSTPKKDWLDTSFNYVDGLAASELRRLVALDVRRKFGAFFTPKELGKVVANEIFPVLNADSIIYDSACGAGNLLLSVWDFLHEHKIRPKNKHFLLGSDIHSEFVSAAQIRLGIKQLMLQAEKGTNTCPADNRFVINQIDGLHDNKYYAQATHIFVNPPFNLMPTPEDTTWTKGNVSAAALFIDRIIKYVNKGATITAILPEVLRSGSRYHHWRYSILKECTTEKIKLLGQFDKYTDIDVFAITLRKKRDTIAIHGLSSCFQPSQKSKQTVTDYFKVCVGPVVDNRDPNTGRRRGYIISKGLPGWSVQTQFSKTRNYQGKSFSGPFIVIKRTSRMGEGKRAIATIINMPKPVYVDNHLIVLTPKSGKISDCEKMISNLKDNRTDEWLNEKIRCRHLTVKIVSMIPIWQ